MKKIIPFPLLLIFMTSTSLGWAVTPMEYYNSLVAGGDEAGSRDGAFSLARFHDPMGLAFDETGNKLYVADSGNHLIRVVFLDHQNDVKTLAGTGFAGKADGSLLKASFNDPTALATLPENRLVVYDSGNGLIRLIDLQKQRVSTIAREINIRTMVYRTSDNSLYFSEPGNKKVEKMDMKSFVVSTVFSNRSEVSSPGALCLFRDSLCVADSHLPTIYSVETDFHSSPATASVSFSALGKAKDVLALATSDGFLYALQRGGLMVKVGLPKSGRINFQTAWGFLIKNEDHEGATALFKIQEELSVGFLASTNEPRKFFISSKHSIVSVKDYDFEKWWSAFKDNDNHLTDFDYPAKKPARTFRILAIGTSRNSTAVPIPSDPKANIDESIETDRTLTFSKRLELILNTEAALRNLNIHFEVLNLTHRGEAISTFAYYEVPDLVKKYDIDLVLGLADHTGYKDYYLKPLTSEGIPSKSIDYEYILKPLSEHAPAGVARDLLERCKKIKIPVSEKQDFPGDGYWSLLCNGDQKIQDDLKEMAGRRLQLLNDKLNAMKTSGGNRPQLALYFAPGGTIPNDCCASFWSGACTRYHLKFFDLSESYNALKPSYSPTYVDHFTTYGNELVAQLLSHYLVKEKLIPF